MKKADLYGITIEEDGDKFNIVYSGENGGATLATCWDYLLAEELRDATERYLHSETHVVRKEMSSEDGMVSEKTKVCEEIDDELSAMLDDEGDDEPMVATIEIPRKKLDLLNDLLENGCDYEEAGVDPDSHVFSTTAKFPDGIEADLNVCSEEEGSDGFWSEICLYNSNGQEVALGEPSYGALGGEEEFEVNGNIYVVKIVGV